MEDKKYKEIIIGIVALITLALIVFFSIRFSGKGKHEQQYISEFQLVGEQLNLSTEKPPRPPEN